MEKDRHMIVDVVLRYGIIINDPITEDYTNYHAPVFLHVIHLGAPRTDLCRNCLARKLYVWVGIITPGPRIGAVLLVVVLLAHVVV